MIRSGEHELWDARMATSRARAEFAGQLAALNAVFRPFARGMTQTMVSVAEATKDLRRFQDQWYGRG